MELVHIVVKTNTLGAPSHNLAPKLRELSISFPLTVHTIIISRCPNERQQVSSIGVAPPPCIRGDFMSLEVPSKANLQMFIFLLSVFGQSLANPARNAQFVISTCLCWYFSLY